MKPKFTYIFTINPKPEWRNTHPALGNTQRKEIERRRERDRTMEQKDDVYNLLSFILINRVESISLLRIMIVHSLCKQNKIYCQTLRAHTRKYTVFFSSTRFIHQRWICQSCPLVLAVFHVNRSARRMLVDYSHFRFWFMKWAKLQFF